MGQVNCSVNTSSLFTVQLGRPLGWGLAQNMGTLQLDSGNNPNMTDPYPPSSNQWVPAPHIVCLRCQGQRKLAVALNISGEMA